MELGDQLPGCGLEDRGSSNRWNWYLEGSADQSASRDFQCAVGLEI